MTNSSGSVRLAACDCLTPLGTAEETLAALLRGERALQARPVLGAAGGDPVPLALMSDRTLDDTAPPAWGSQLQRLARSIPGQGWGSVRRPVFVTSSNFGVGNLLEFRRGGGTQHLKYGAPFLCVDWLSNELGWGENVFLYTHACVSAHLGLLAATRMLHAGIAEQALVFSFDFLSPFVAGGFHALKILNAEFPAPFCQREIGAIGLGDGAGFAVLTREAGDFAIAGQSVFNELGHFTANAPDGSGFRACLAPLAEATRGRSVWCKGHGTGTLDAGRLEAEAFAALFPHAPLVGWKGALGHTLGSCGLLELALASVALRGGTTPGTVAAGAPTFTPEVALASFDNRSFDGVICASNAFGGAHAALFLRHA